MTETTNAVPNPGTYEAVARGCICPVIDNEYGRGWKGKAGTYVYTVGCPFHSTRRPLDRGTGND